MDREAQPVYADDNKESILFLLKLRLPWLAAGLTLGLIATVLVSTFEKVLATEVSLAFYMPIVVYISDAVGTQTQTVYVRALAKGHPKFGTYFFKELIQGIVLGILFGSVTALFSYFWQKELTVAISVGLAMLGSIASATLIALLVALALKREHQDPAVGAGPVTTVIQDVISLVIYFLIASALVLN